MPTSRAPPKRTKAKGNLLIGKSKYLPLGLVPAVCVVVFFLHILYASSRSVVFHDPGRLGDGDTRSGTPVKKAVDAVLSPAEHTKLYMYIYDKLHMNVHRVMHKLIFIKTFFIYYEQRSELQYEDFQLLADAYNFNSLYDRAASRECAQECVTEVHELEKLIDSWAWFALGYTFRFYNDMKAQLLDDEQYTYFLHNVNRELFLLNKCYHGYSMDNGPTDPRLPSWQACSKTLCRTFLRSAVVDNSKEFETVLQARMDLPSCGFVCVIYKYMSSELQYPHTPKKDGFYDLMRELVPHCTFVNNFCEGMLTEEITKAVLDFLEIHSMSSLADESFIDNLCWTAAELCLNISSLVGCASLCWLVFWNKLHFLVLPAITVKNLSLACLSLPKKACTAIVSCRPKKQTEPCPLVSSTKPMKNLKSDAAPSAGAVAAGRTRRKVATVTATVGHLSSSPAALASTSTHRNTSSEQTQSSSLPKPTSSCSTPAELPSSPRRPTSTPLSRKHLSAVLLSAAHHTKAFVPPITQENKPLASAHVDSTPTPLADVPTAESTEPAACSSSVTATASGPVTQSSAAPWGSPANETATELWSTDASGGEALPVDELLPGEEVSASVRDTSAFACNTALRQGDATTTASRPAVRVSSNSPMRPAPTHVPSLGPTLPTSPLAATSKQPSSSSVPTTPRCQHSSPTAPIERSNSCATPFADRSLRQSSRHSYLRSLEHTSSSGSSTTITSRQSSSSTVDFWNSFKDSGFIYQGPAVCPQGASPMPTTPHPHVPSCSSGPSWQHQKPVGSDGGAEYAVNPARKTKPTASTRLGQTLTQFDSNLIGSRLGQTLTQLDSNLIGSSFYRADVAVGQPDMDPVSCQRQANSGTGGYAWRHTLTPVPSVSWPTAPKLAPNLPSQSHRPLKLCGQPEATRQDADFRGHIRGPVGLDCQLGGMPRKVDDRVDESHIHALVCSMVDDLVGHEQQPQGVGPPRGVGIQTGHGSESGRLLGLSVENHMHSSQSAAHTNQVYGSLRQHH